MGENVISILKRAEPIVPLCIPSTVEGLNDLRGWGRVGSVRSSTDAESLSSCFGREPRATFDAIVGRFTDRWNLLYASCTREVMT
jgi:hypothetical protein